MGENKKVANSVVALSSAAVLAIYGVGYARTREAADRFAQQAAERRPRVPAARDSEQRVALDVTAAASDAAPAPVPAPPPEAAPPAIEAPADDVVAKSVDVEAKAATPAITKPAATAARPAAPKTEPAVEAAAPASATAASQPSPADEEPAVPEQTTASVPVPAPAPAPPVAVAPEPAKGAYKDGTFLGWGTSRHGDIQAAVVIESGRITVARVERCETRYSCSWITPIPPRILSKQGTTYDYVSGATESSDAFQDAVAEALSQAK